MKDTLQEPTTDGPGTSWLMERGLGAWGPGLGACIATGYGRVFSFFLMVYTCMYFNNAVLQVQVQVFQVGNDDNDQRH